ncbi:hypothetical protein HZA33_03210 [Candidatus Pacearchaeota archaeon]|nr:hypothetical protein [Candidatus Pacearchaeota archaeon]
MANENALESRKGLLKEELVKKGIEYVLSNPPFSVMGPSGRMEYRTNLLTFVELEEKLIEQGHKGKYALIYKGQCLGVGDNKTTLEDSFRSKMAFGAISFCSRIGGGA